MLRLLRCSLLVTSVVGSATAQVPATVPHWSTYFGSPGTETVVAMGTGPGRLVTLVGHTNSDGLATPGSFQVARAGGVDAFVARFDPDQPPGQQLLWCTYLGGTELEFAFDAAVDPMTGLTFVAGLSRSLDFPDPTGANPPLRNGPSDGFVAVLDASGQSLLGAIFVGGSRDDRICEVEIDAAGTVVVAGVTESTDLPGTSGSAQPGFRGGISDAFVARLSPFGAGSTTWASYLGGAGNEGIALSSLGNAWEGNLDRMAMTFDPGRREIVVATECITSASPPPTGPNAPQPGHAGAADVYIAVLDGAGSAVRYGTFVGGTGADRPKSIALHPAGGFVVGGITFSANMPVSAGCLQTGLQPSPAAAGRDGFLVWIDPALGTSGRRYASYLGGDAGEDNVLALACETSGLVTAVGYTRGGNFPTTAGALTSVPTPGQTHGYVLRLRLGDGGRDDLAYGSLIAEASPGTYTGWAALTLDEFGDAWCAGDTTSPVYPLVAPYQPFLAGGLDPVITHLPLLPGGAARRETGSARSSCAGRLYAGLHGAPRPGNAAFALSATNAPPGGAGVLLLGTPAAAPVPVLNALLLVDPLASGGTVLSDALGYAEQRLPVPVSLPVGIALAAQWFFLNTPSCPGSGPLGASERLEFRTF
jgi:hypothetical protein